MSNRTRWILAVLVLVVAGAVALWPRGADTGAGTRTQPGAPSRPAPDLVAARAKAALPPCTPTTPAAAQHTGAAASARLSGLRASCLADGTPVNLGDALGEGPVLVNVWAFWCMPCRDELPLLAAYAAEPGAVRVVTVAVQSDDSNALEVLTALGVRLPAVLDTDGSVEKKLNAPAIPASYLVDGRGEVRLIDQPRLFESLDQIRTAVARYAAAGSGTR